MYMTIVLNIAIIIKKRVTFLPILVSNQMVF